MKTVYILRSVSGAGKTTLAKELESQLDDCVTIAADDFWYDLEGNYNFDIKRLSEAHTWCKQEFTQYVIQGKTNIVIHNTNTSEKEIQYYVDMAEEYNYKVVSLVVENRHGNTNLHNVPEDVLINQEKRLRNSLKFR